MVPFAIRGVPAGQEKPGECRTFERRVCDSPQSAGDPGMSRAKICIEETRNRSPGQGDHGVRSVSGDLFDPADGTGQHVLVAAYQVVRSEFEDLGVPLSMGDGDLCSCHVAEAADDREDRTIARGNGPVFGCVRTAQAELGGDMPGQAGRSRE